MNNVQLEYTKFLLENTEFAETTSSILDENTPAGILDTSWAFLTEFGPFCATQDNELNVNILFTFPLNKLRKELKKAPVHLTKLTDLYKLKVQTYLFNHIPNTSSVDLKRYSIIWNSYMKFVPCVHSYLIDIRLGKHDKFIPITYENLYTEDTPYIFDHYTPFQTVLFATSCFKLLV